MYLTEKEIEIIVWDRNKERERGEVMEKIRQIKGLYTGARLLVCKSDMYQLFEIDFK